MKKNKNTYRYIVVIISLLFILPTNTVAQYDLGFYSMRAVPQTNQLNPAFIPDYKFHFGLPTFSSTLTGFGTSGPHYNQMFMVTPGDSLGINNNSILDNIGSSNNINNKNINQWLYGGMKWNDFYFSISIGDVTDVNAQYSDKLVQLLLKGNSQFIGEKVSLNPIELKAIHYREYAMGVSWDLNSNLNIGIKAKALFGKAVINTEQMNFELLTTEDYYNLEVKSNFIVNTSIPEIVGDSATDWMDYTFSDANFGLGFDFGATYNIDDLWSVSASILDVGYIDFDRYQKTYTSNTEFTYKGIDAIPFIELNDDERETRINEIKDSLIDLFEVEESNQNFRVPLTAKMYLGADYNFNNKVTLGALVRLEFFKGIVRPSFTASYYRTLGENFSISASYTMINRSYLNFGLGLVANFEPFQFYIATDNIIGVVAPEMVKYANIHVGINFVFKNDIIRLPMINL